MQGKSAANLFFIGLLVAHAYFWMLTQQNCYFYRTNEEVNSYFFFQDGKERWILVSSALQLSQNTMCLQWLQFIKNNSVFVSTVFGFYVYFQNSQ